MHPCPSCMDRHIYWDHLPGIKSQASTSHGVSFQDSLASTLYINVSWFSAVGSTQALFLPGGWGVSLVLSSSLFPGVSCLFFFVVFLLWARCLLTGISLSPLALSFLAPDQLTFNAFCKLVSTDLGALLSGTRLFHSICSNHCGVWNIALVCPCGPLHTLLPRQVVRESTAHLTLLEFRLWVPFINDSTCSFSHHPQLPPPTLYHVLLSEAEIITI